MIIISQLLLQLILLTSHDKFDIHSTYYQYEWKSDFFDLT